MKLLIAFDGSPHSELAVKDLRLAGLAVGAEAVVLSVLDSRSCDQRAAAGEEPRSAQAQENFRDALDRQCEIAERGVHLVRNNFPGWKVTPEVCIGSPAWEIIQRAESGGGDQRPIDLTVVGSRGLGEFKRLLLGSVAHRVVTTVRGSVRISRGQADRLNASPGAAPRLIIGVDGSKDAHAALVQLASRNWPAGTRVVIATFETGPLAMVRHWEPSTVWGGAPLTAGAPAADGRPALRVATEAAEFLRGRRRDLVVNTLVRPADPKYALLGAAEEWDKDGADCIFVGASGVRGLARFLLGSVSTSVALNATCSVEVVR